MFRVAIASLAIGSIIASSAVYARQPIKTLSVDKLIGGGLLLRVQDESLSRCINTEQDVVTLTLVRMIARKESRKHWITGRETTAMGLVVETAISGDDGVGDTKKVSFPRSFTIDVSKTKETLISLPVEQRILSRFSLSRNSNIYTNVDVDIKSITVKKNSNAHILLNTLSEITEELPFPKNPFSEGFTYFVKYSKSIEKNFSNDGGELGRFSEAKFGLNFSTDATCSSGEEKTGAIVILKKGISGYDSIKLGEISKYCLSVDKINIHTLMAARSKTENRDDCESEKLDWFPVENPYSIFLLHATKRLAKKGKDNLTYGYSASNASTTGSFVDGLRGFYDPKTTESDWRSRNTLIGIPFDETADLTRRYAYKWAEASGESIQEDQLIEISNQASDILLNAAFQENSAAGMLGTIVQDRQSSGWEGVQINLPRLDNGGSEGITFNDGGVQNPLHDQLFGVGFSGQSYSFPMINDPGLKAAFDGVVSDVRSQGISDVGVNLNISGSDGVALDIANTLARCRFWGVDLKRCN